MNAILPIIKAGAVEILEPRRRRFTVDDIDAMVESGLIDRDARIELLDGEIIEMPSEGELHMTFKAVLNKVLSSLVGDDWWVVPDASQHLAPDDVPEPDFYILPTGSKLKPVNPGEIALVIEIADSTLSYDLGRKAAKYASYGIAEYWVVDVKARQTHVLTEPGDGSYHAATAVPFEAELKPHRLTQVSLTIATLRGVPAA